MTTEITATTIETLTAEQKLDLFCEAGRQAFIARRCERKAETARLAANRLAREAAVAAGTLTAEDARQAAIADLMAQPQRTPASLLGQPEPEPATVIETTATIVDEQPEPEPPAPTSGALTRDALITAAGDPSYLATLSTLGRTSMILSNLLHTASEADAWSLAAACRWLLGRMTVLGLHSHKKSQKAVTQQVARLVDAALERAKVEAAAEAEALMLASQASANIARSEQQLFAAEPIASWVASLNAPPVLPADLFPDSLLDAQPETLGEQMICAWADALFGPTEPEIGNAGRCGWCGRYDCICDQEPEPPEPTSPASAPLPHEAEIAEAVALYDAWESAQVAARYEQEQAFWRDYNAKRTQIAMEAACRVEAMCEGLDVLDDDVMEYLEDEAAEWDAYMSVAA